MDREENAVQHRTRLIATGSYLPGSPVPNEALSQFPAEFIPLIAQKTGIRARHYAAPEAVYQRPGI